MKHAAAMAAPQNGQNCAGPRQISPPVAQFCAGVCD
jgi:hypothetical protein